MKKFFSNNGLSIVFISLFIVSFLGQIYFGFLEHNDDLQKDNAPAIEIDAYLRSGHFLQATFENWESEFLQMALFILLSISLRQKGSSESKTMEEDETSTEPPACREDVPWPVKKGGIILKMYEHPLSLAFILLFIASFALHFYGSLKDENEQLLRKGKPLLEASVYLLDPRLWFESFQNWQSEFLSVFAIVFLSIYLREKGSAQSKPVDAPHSKTGA